MKTKRFLKNIVTILILLLWVPVAMEKLLHFTTFESAILAQPLPSWLAYTVIYTLPASEILVAVLLLWTRYRRLGFALSTLLMAAFTTYIGLALLGAWGKLPCACGSVIAGMSWKQHLWFNLFFLATSVAGWKLQKE